MANAMHYWDRARTGLLIVRIMGLSRISDRGADGLASQKSLPQVGTRPHMTLSVARSDTTNTNRESFTHFAN